MEVFNVRCTGWINCLGVDNHLLTYNHYVSYMNVGSNLLFYSGLNSSVSLLFPAGDENDDFRTRMTVVVRDHSLYL